MARGGNRKKADGRRRTVSSSRRLVPFRTPKKIFLIVCEGQKTEPNYFNELRASKRLSSAYVVVVPGNKAGITPKKLVEYAKKLISHYAYIFDEVWCVFDRDDHTTVEEAFVMARANGIKVAFSNPSFELWYLLHFDYQTATIHRDQVYHLVKCMIPRYDKAMSGVYAVLKDRQAEATNRAEKLRKYHSDNLEPATRNPSTHVDLLVKELEELEII